MDFPVEYRDRMLAEQLAMMDAFQFIAQILICFFILVSFVILIVNLSGAVRVRLNERSQSEHRQPPPPPLRKAARLCNPVRIASSTNQKRNAKTLN